MARQKTQVEMGDKFIATPQPLYKQTLSDYSLRI